MSTVSRELKRNRFARSYRPSKAQEKYQKRRKHCRRHKILGQADIKEKVVTLLTGQQWSPEQISKRMELECGGPVVSYSTIYRAIKTGDMEPKERRKKKNGRYFMERYLRRKGWRGKKRHIFTVELKNALNLRKIAAVSDTLRAIWYIAAVTSYIL